MIPAAFLTLCAGWFGIGIFWGHQWGSNTLQPVARIDLTDEALAKYRGNGEHLDLADGISGEQCLGLVDWETLGWLP